MPGAVYGGPEIRGPVYGGTNSRLDHRTMRLLRADSRPEEKRRRQKGFLIICRTNIVTRLGADRTIKIEDLELLSAA